MLAAIQNSTVVAVESRTSPVGDRGWFVAVDQRVRKVDGTGSSAVLPGSQPGSGSAGGVRFFLLRDTLRLASHELLATRSAAVHQGGWRRPPPGPATAREGISDEGDTMIDFVSTS